MREGVSQTLLAVLGTGLIVGGFWYFRQQGTVTVESEGRSLPSAPGAGTHRFEKRALRAAELEPGASVVYLVPGSADRLRFGWVLAHEGQKVSVEGRTIRVNGEQVCDLDLLAGTSEKPGPLVAAASALARNANSPAAPAGCRELVVPRGCVLLLAANPAEDSTALGPIPVSLVAGRLR